MGFRDDGEAVRARAEALARQLEEKDARVAELEAKLAEKAAKLAERDATLEAEATGREQAERAEAKGREQAEQADARLEALRARGAEEARQRAAAEKARVEQTTLAGERELDARRLASVSVWGHVDLLPLIPVVAVPTLLGSLWMMAQVGVYAAALPVAALLAVAFAKYGGLAWARRCLREEEAWARALPYELLGYPALLGQPPGSRHGMILRLDGSDHRILQLELRFADGEGPKDLDGLVQSFDSELDSKHPAREGPARWINELRGEVEAPPPHPVYYRPSPVSSRRTKHGSSFVETEHNRAVRAWVRRLEAELLRPLHTRHPLTRVEIRLR